MNERRAVIREARPEDIPVIHRIRMSVRENRLTSRVITEAETLDAITRTGRGWVAEAQGQIVGFAIGNAETGNIWALFIDPAHERRGYGRKLHDAMVGWLWSCGLRRLWLTTDPGTRAERFYKTAGWVRTGKTASGEVRFELDYADRHQEESFRIGRDTLP